MDFDAHGWLWKHSLPSVVFPSTMKRLLIKFFNEIPHVSPEGAILRLKALPQYRLDVFVEFLLTPMRVMRYFTTLNKHRKDHKIASNMPVPEHIADIEGDNSQHQGIGNKPKLAALICRRKISFLKPSQLCKPSFDRRVLVQMLLDDDAKLEDNHGSKFEEEAFEKNQKSYPQSLRKMPQVDPRLTKTRFFLRNHSVFNNFYTKMRLDHKNNTQSGQKTNLEKNGIRPI